jgi:ADP-ribosylglycohydrolase
MRRDSIRGLVYGALIGDAVGVQLKYSLHKPTPAQVDRSFRLEGGGYHGVAMGQFSQASEITMLLLQCLKKRSCGYDNRMVALAYRRWYLSLPFEIDQTLINVCRDICPYRHDVVECMMQNASERNYECINNSCFIRVVALSMVTCRMSEADSIDLILEDLRLTHPNPILMDAVIAYALALRHLLIQERDAIGAVKIVGKYLYNRNPEVEDWFADAIIGYQPPSCPYFNSARHSFIYVFYHLYRQTPYSQAIKETLLQGGDTDTNCFLVGAMMGAYYGQTDDLKTFSPLMCFKMTHADVTLGNQIRHHEYRVGRLRKLMTYFSDTIWWHSSCRYL